MPWNATGSAIWWWGGLAVNLHGIPRMTMDVDLVPALDGGNLAGFFAACAELELRPQVPVALAALADLADLADPQERRRRRDEKGMIALPLYSAREHGPTVDILIDPGLEWAAAAARAVRRDLAGVAVWVAAVEDLIALKERSGRRQDLADIEHLRRIAEEGK